MGSSPKPKDCEGPHFRCSWHETPPLQVLPHTTWAVVKNGGGGDIGSAGSLVQHYNKAKNEHSVDDAIAVIENYWDANVVTQLIEVLNEPLRRNIPLIVVFPTPKFQDTGAGAIDGKFITNALPGVLADYIALNFSATVETGITQKARPGKTSLNGIQRFLYQPKFIGAVRSDAMYILVDDAYTHGGTLATLRSHIVENGGTVAAVCVLCNKTGKPVSFPVTDEQVTEIKSFYGSDVGEFWKEQVGHHVTLLTHNEALFLEDWAKARFRERVKPPLLQRLRARFDSARATGK